MNIFSTKSGIAGEAPVTHLNRSLTETQKQVFQIILDGMMFDDNVE